MLHITEEELFSKQIKFHIKLGNQEIKLYNYFLKKTGISPNTVVIKDTFLFFFINPDDYFKSMNHIGILRKSIRDKRVLIIRAEETLISQIFSLFPDVYISNIKLKYGNINKVKVSIYSLTYRDRSIAIGKRGKYIIAVNKLFSDVIKIQGCPIIELEWLPSSLL